MRCFKIITSCSLLLVLSLLATTVNSISSAATSMNTAAAARPPKNGFFFPIIHIRTDNFLPDNNGFSIHCKSKDDDLGQVNVGAKGSYSFKFRPNIYGSTLFFCDVSWTGGSLTFDIYDYARDWNRCYHWCIWQVRSDAVVGFIQSKPTTPDITIPWPKKT